MPDEQRGEPERRIPWSPLDHDILIEVRTIVRRMEDEWAAERRQTWEKLGNIDSRIGKVETLIATLQPEKAHERYDKHFTEWERFKNRWQGFALAFGIVGGFLSWALQYIVGLLR